MKISDSGKKFFIAALIAIGVLVLAYLLRKVAVPPDCVLEPDNPACRQP